MRLLLTLRAQDSRVQVHVTPATSQEDLALLYLPQCQGSSSGPRLRANIMGWCQTHWSHPP